MKILLIGDYCIDRFVQGDCKRLSPEAPVPVLLPLSTGQNPGMAGNVEANLRSLAPEAEIITLYPERTSIKTRYVDRSTNYHLLRVDEDAYCPALKKQDFLDALATRGPFDAVVLSDYAKGFLNKDIMADIARECEQQGIPTFMDTKCILGPWSRAVTVVKINSKEYEAQINAGVLEPWKECHNLVWTKGRDGMAMFDQQGNIWYETGPSNVKVYDVVGAGDSVLAALVIGYLETRIWPRAMDFAAKVAAYAVSQPGVTAVKRQNVV